MNQFFESHGDVSFDIPRAAFARFEQSEPIDLDDSEEAVLIFSAVNADWFESQTSDIYSLAPDSHAPSFWKQYWSALFDNDGRQPPSENLFENMPLLRYEISVTREQDNFDRFREICNDEVSWFRIVSDPLGELKADVYGNLFGVAQTTIVSLYKADSHEARVLSSIFDMDTWPDAEEDELLSAITIHKRSVALAAFDVGQGSASALLDKHQIPWLFHDLGAGVTRNAHTMPKPLTFCWLNDPVIVLSHWDSDHWAGALQDRDALKQTWIAPRQAIGKTHAAFANEILRAGGRILIWPNGIRHLEVHNTKYNQSITIGRCTGTNRNGTCLAMRVDDNSKGGTTLHWLLTGDAGYHQLPFVLTGNVAAMIVPHHGARMAGNRCIPRRSSNAYARLLFSFGPGNKHGRTGVSHPTSSAVYAHQQHGWDMGTWKNTTQPGFTVAGGDVLATAKHSSNHLSGAIAGWSRAPIPHLRFCIFLLRKICKSLCTAAIKQS